MVNFLQLFKQFVILAGMIVLVGCGVDHANKASKFDYLSDKADLNIVAGQKIGEITTDLRRYKVLGKGVFADNVLSVIPQTRALVIAKVLDLHNEYVFKNKLEQDTEAIADLEAKALLEIKEQYQKYAKTRSCFQFELNNIDFPGLNDLTYWYGNVLVNGQSYPLVFEKDTISNVSINSYRKVNYYGHKDRWYLGSNGTLYTISGLERTGSDTYPVVIKNTTAVMCMDTKIDFTQPFTVTLEPRTSKDCHALYVFSWKSKDQPRLSK